MRHAVISLLPLVALAACGVSEESARNTFRQSSIEGCVSASRTQAPPALAGFDWERLCSCATDRIMEGKSVSELAQFTPGGPDQTAAVQQCVADMQRDGAGPGDAATG